MSKYLVTGGAGFIGSNISETLVAQGHEVRIIDNLSTGHKENIQSFIEKVQFIEGDIRHYDQLKDAMRGVDFVLHQAALPSVPRSVTDPIASNENNVTGTLNVLNAARELGIKRVVYAASSSAYGNTPVLPKVEEMKANPLSPYAVSKYTGELYCKVFYEIYGLETLAIRYFNVFGPKQDPESQYAAVIPKFIKLMLAGQQPVIFGDGEQSRDFSFIANVVSANILATQAPKTEGQVINVACGERITLNELISILNEIMGTDIQPLYNNDRPGDVKHSLADIRLAKKLINYEPVVGHKEGLKQTFEWYKSQM